MKKILCTIFFLFGLHINASVPSGRLSVILYRGTVCSVSVNVDKVENCIDFLNAITLIGTGSDYYYLGNLTISFHKNTTNYPHNLNLQCTTYDTATNKFSAIHSNGLASLVIGVQKNFDLEGDRTPYTYIDPTSASVVIRTIDEKVCPEEHTLYFYILESPTNVFFKGTYTCHFILTFSS